MKTFFSILLTIAILFSFGSFSCKKDSKKSTVTSIEDLLVKNNEITGWQYGNATWVANNGSDLTRYVDGGAETYIKYGFVEASNQMYTGSINNLEATINVRVFDMTSDENVVLLMDDPDLNLASGLVWSDNNAGENARYFRYNGMSEQMYFSRDKYLVLIESSTDSEESLNIVKQFAYNVDEKIKNSLK